MRPATPGGSGRDRSAKPTSVRASRAYSATCAVSVGVVAEASGQVPSGATAICVDIKCRQHAGGQELVLQQIAVEEALDRDDRFGRGMGHGHQLASPADPDIAGGIGHRRVEQGDIRADRRHQDDGSRL